MAVRFTNNSAQVKGLLDAACIAFLEEAGGELASQTKSNSRPVKYGSYDVKNSWDHKVNEANMEVKVGSPLEAAYWEELGTGEYALNHDGRKGWWVYVEGNQTPSGNQKMYTEDEAKKAAAFLRSKGLDAHATKGTVANRPLFTAFNTKKGAIKEHAKAVFKARFTE